MKEEQGNAASLALEAKQGKVDAKTLRGAAKQLYNSMTATQLEEYAVTKRKLPQRTVGQRPPMLRHARSA